MVTGSARLNGGVSAQKELPPTPFVLKGYLLIQHVLQLTQE